MNLPMNWGLAMAHHPSLTHQRSVGRDLGHAQQHLIRQSSANDLAPRSPRSSFAPPSSQQSSIAGHVQSRSPAQLSAPYGSFHTQQPQGPAWPQQKTQSHTGSFHLTPSYNEARPNVPNFQ